MLYPTLSRFRASLWLSWYRTRLQCRRPGSAPVLGRPPGEGNGHPLQYSGLENSMDYIYSPWGCKELDTIEQLSVSRFTLILGTGLTNSSGSLKHRLFVVV